jgi:hypothetical protein
MLLKWNQSLFIIVFLIGILTIALSLNASLWLPSYDPHTFTEDFSDPILNSNLWSFVPANQDNNASKGTYSIQDSEITLNAPTGGVSFLKHSYVTFWPSGVNYGAWMGSIEFSVRFNNLSDNSVSLKLARIDGGWVGIVNSHIVYHDEIGGTGYALQSSIDNNWHSFKIRYGYAGREVYWDRRLAASVHTVERFTYLILGHSEAERFGGGSASFALVKSYVEHKP